MKVRFLSILAIVALFAACNPFVIDLLPDRNGKTYTVTFDKNGGTTEASPQTITVTAPETTVKTLPAEPARTGYEFAGWNTQANGSGDTFTAATTVTEDITVYAQWISENAFAVNFQMTGNIAGDSLTAVPKAAEDGETVTINYTIAGGFINNRLVFSGIKAHIALVDADTNGTTGTRTYKVDKDDAIGRAITIVAAFTHTNKNIDTIELPAESVQKEYGDTAFSMAVTNSGQGSGAITYTSSNTNIATVDSVGLVTIVAAGACEIIATKAADDVWETTTDTCTLHIAKRKLTISAPTVTQTKQYDTTTTAAVTAVGTLTNKVGTDDVTVSATAAYNSPNVAEANKITVTYSIGGAQAGNYIEPDPYEITSGVSISKAPAPAPVGPMTTYRLTDTIIHLVPVTVAGGEVEYAVSTTNTTPSSGWQDGRIFTTPVVTANTSYYAFARAKESDNYTVGAALITQFTTKATPATNPNVPPYIINFEDEQIGRTYSITAGYSGTVNATVVADPANASQKSMRTTVSGSNTWNRAPIIPITLPFALENYQSFSFRFYLTSGSPVPINNISVYVKGDANYATGGFGNAADSSNPQFANLLLGEVKADYSMTGQWVEYTIDLPNTLDNAIRNLSGVVYLAIGININTEGSPAINYLFDDITFNAKSTYSPSPTISPTSATFVKREPPQVQEPVVVTMNLYGETLSSIKNGNSTLTSGTNYTTSSNVITLTTTYLAAQAIGTTTLTFTFSDNSTKDIAIRIRDASMITEYDFTTNPSVTLEYERASAADLSAAMTSGALRVTKTTGHSSPKLIVPLELGSTTLGSYSTLRFVMRGVSGDLANTPFTVEVLSGTTWTSIGSVSTGSFGTANFANYDVSISTSTISGSIKIRFGLTNKPSYVYDIQSITLIP